MIVYNYDADLEVSDTCVRSSLLSWVELSMTKISRPRKCENFVLQYFYRCCRRLHHQVPAVRRQHRAAVGLVAIGPRGLYTVLGPSSSLFAYSATVCTARTPERPQKVELVWLLHSTILLHTFTKTTPINYLSIQANTKTRPAGRPKPIVRDWYYQPHRRPQIS